MVKEKVIQSVDIKVTYEEYRKMKKKFPHLFWKRFFLVMGILLSLFLIADFPTSALAVVEIFQISLVLFLIVYVIFKIIDFFFLKISYKKMFRKTPESIKYTLSFLDDSIEKKSLDQVQRIPYHQIDRIEETETHFYILVSKVDILSIPKEDCNDSLCRYIRSIPVHSQSKTMKSENLLEYISPQIRYAKTRKFLIFLFILALCSIWAGLLLPLGVTYLMLPSAAIQYFPEITLHLSNVSVSVQSALVADYLWCSWILLPIPLLSLFLGIRYRNKGLKCTKNIVVGCLASFLLLPIGFASNVYHAEREYQEISKYQEIIDVKVPKDGRLFRFEWNETGIPQIDYVLWKDTEEVREFHKSIEQNTKWIPYDQIQLDNRTIFVPECLSQKEKCYYSLYTENFDRYNVLPEEAGQYHGYSMVYDPEIFSLKFGEFMYFVEDAK